MSENINMPWVDYKIERGPIRNPELRGKVGLQLSVTARPEIEAFMRDLAHNNRLGVGEYGDSWLNCKTDGKMLETYSVDLKQPTTGYTLSRVAMPLLIDAGRGRQVGAPVPRFAREPIGDENEVAVVGGRQEQIVNLSFLTLVGISEGVTLGIVGVFSAEYLMTLRQRLPKMTRQFLQDFIVPMTINLQIVSRTQRDM